MRSHLPRLRFSALAVLLALAAIFWLRPLVMPAQDKAHGHAEPGDVEKHDEGHGKTVDDAHGKKADGGGGGLIKVIPQLLHVIDVKEFHFFDVLGPLPLPKLLGFFQVTKYMVLELIAAVLIVLIYVPLAYRLKSGEPARGAFANTFEVLLTFVRDQIAKPNLGDHTDRYVPFLWTLFLFILFNNILGMFPFGGSATASPFVTFALALIVFFAIHGAAIYEMGSAPDHGHGEHGHENHAHEDHGHDHGQAAEAAGLWPVVKKGSGRYLHSFWPQIDLPAWPLGMPIKGLVFCLEIMGVLVRNGVLAIRLFANMFAGHMVTATILFFIKLTAELHPALWATVTISSVLGIVALSLLELFVAFLQAYIFTFLTSLFMGMAMSPQH
jgi:F-type H+-transporting ATPase subunit a